jgi:monoamine oxidase
MQPDVVIVGAGAAGVGAGLELQARGVPFVILEAADRVGGRAFTDHTSLPAAWDQGCHWFHCADVNPLVAWADRLGIAYEAHDSMTSALWQSGRWLDADENARSDAAFDAAFGAVYASLATEGDRSLDEVLPRTGPWAPVIRNVARLMSSGEPDAVSARGYADYDDTQVNYAVLGGYGALIARMAEGLPVRLGTPVTRIAHAGRGVRVTTFGGEIAAQAAIVTASTNVLAAGAIGIDSAEAAPVLDRVAEVPCGAYEKVAVALRRWPEGPPAQFYWIAPGDGALGINVQVSRGAEPMLIAHFGGDDARDLAEGGEAAMTALVIDRLASAFGSAIRGDILGTAVTGWQKNRYVRGGYSHTRPGRWTARHEMIAAETGDIVFAGEAFSANWYATAHGAYQSGREVAARLASRLGRG